MMVENHTKRRLLNYQGFTLLEALIAITLMALMVLALYRSAAMIMTRNVENTLQDTCMKVANEKIEDLRNMPFNSIPLGTSIDNVTREVRNFQRTFTRRTFVYKRTNTLYTVSVTVSWELHQGNVHNCTVNTVIAKHY